jgi:hypothetical protein
VLWGNLSLDKIKPCLQAGFFYALFSLDLIQFLGISALLLKNNV